MPTFSYSPTESVTFAPGGDVSVKNGSTITTYSKTVATKTITKDPPDPHPPGPETPFSQKTKPNGDLIHTYADITKTPPVTTRVTYKSNGDVEILITIGQDRTKFDILGSTGVRRTRIWRDPDPEPETWTKTELPRGSHSNGGGGSSPGARKKAKKKVLRTKTAKRSIAKRRPQQKSKKKVRRR
ncbi:MAG TPA: hypothetical protein VKU80_10185 [Planctomycetota bacterium]|nr:hypothetical protein [Planctomycetota bacterium]